MPWYRVSAEWGIDNFDVEADDKEAALEQLISLLRQGVISLYLEHPFYWTADEISEEEASTDD
jgi:hypothetical protein